MTTYNFNPSTTPRRLTAGYRIAIALLISMIVSVGSAQAGDGVFNLRYFKTKLSRAQASPQATGFITKATMEIKFNAAFSKATVTTKITGSGSTVLAGEFHCGPAGAFGEIVLDLDITGVGTTVTTITNADIIHECASIPNLISLAYEMRRGLVYGEIYTGENPPGGGGAEVRGQFIELEN